MNGCPICQGTLVHKTSSAGQEIYCNDCRNIIVSASLNFRFAFGDEGDTDAYGEDAEETTGYDAEPEGSDDTGAGGGASIEQCFLNGLPGWKGAGEKSHCYTYPPGSKKDEAKAKQKAMESAYMESREAHVKRLAGGMGAPFTRGTIPDAMGLGTVQDEFGTTVQFDGDLNNNSTSTASRKEAIAMLNNFCTHVNPETCSECGVTH